jgi:hypothetical protein
MVSCIIKQESGPKVVRGSAKAPSLYYLASCPKAERHLWPQTLSSLFLTLMWS